MIEDLLGDSFGEFIGVTLVLFGAAAFMTGQALAQTWRPLWQMLPYGGMLAAANRFLSWAMFGGTLISPVGFIIDAIIMIVIGAVAYRLTLAHKMAKQYPWLYVRSGLFSWRVRADASK
jgi:hypothetical protein